MGQYLRIAHSFKLPLKQVMEEMGSGLEIEIYLAYLNKLEEDDREQKWNFRDKWEWYLARIIKELRAPRVEHAESTKEFLMKFDRVKKEDKPEQMTPEQIKAKKAEISKRWLIGLQAMTGQSQITKLPEKVRQKTEQANHG